MRLLKRLPAGGLELVSLPDDDPPPYAILSHTWTDGQEVTYNEFVSGSGKHKTGYAKICFCVDRATDDGLHYSWVDSCCINKSSSHELSTAINSMFRWYQRAAKCYVYLSDVQMPLEVADVQTLGVTWAEAFRRSRWFTRGWTLQELLAPATVEFYSKEGKLLGSKISLEQAIYQITRIPVGVLRGQNLVEYSVEERMNWAGTRTTTIKEDKIYCLLGICGVFLPLIYGEGEEYAATRLKDEIQRRREGRRTECIQDLAVSSSLPFPRNELFIGRDDQLRTLEQTLLLPTDHRRMTIYGLGGGGKSALALEFAYRALTRLPGHLIFWVPAISQESFELAYREIGTRLSVPGIADDNADIKRLVRNALNSNSMRHWLMIVDNADDPEVFMGGTGGTQGSACLYDYLPNSNRGRILFTTRSRKAAGYLSSSSVLDLNDMSKDEAQQLLMRRIAKPSLLQDKKAVIDLLEILTYLPLAIVQAAAFMNNNDISVLEYILLLQEAGTATELFGEHFEDPSRYREMDSTIAKTWHISFDQIRRQDSLAAEYLSFMACISRISIPQSLLLHKGSLVRQAQAIGTLKAYAFITERQQALHELENEKFFDMHRLAHMASGWWLDWHDEQTAWKAKAAARLQELIPYGGHERKGVWTKYLPHAIHVARRDGNLDDIARASLLDRIGRCQTSLGQYLAAEITQLQVLSLREATLGIEHEQTLVSMNEVGEALIYQGKFKEAESMCKQTLTLRKRALGLEHRSTLESMSNLAAILGSQGKFDEAESLSRLTLARKEEVLGLEDPDTLISMSNLAGVLGCQSKYEEAELMHRQTLARYEKVLGPEHPDTLTSISNLTQVLSSQAKYEEAELINRQTLARREKVLGREHPDTLMSISYLAGVLDRQGKYKEAELMNRQTLARREKVLGREHPDTLMSVYCLAHLLANQHCYNESLALYERACAGYHTVLGRDHPTTRACREHYAETKMHATQGWG